MPSRASAQPSRLLLVAAFAAIYIIWGSTYLAIRVAIETIPPFLMAGARFLTAGALLYGWARMRGVQRPSAASWRAAAILGAFFLLLGNGGVVWAEQRVPSGIAAVLVALLPIWTAIIEWIRPPGKRPTAGVTAGLITGFAGVALLLAPGVGSGAQVDLVGGLVLILASLSWAYAGVISKGLPLPESAVLSSGMQMLAGGALLTLAGLVTGEPGRIALDAVSLRSGAAFLYLIVFGSLVGFSAFAWLLRVSTPGRVATYAYVNPIVAVFLGWLILGEPLAARDIAAAAIIVGGVVLITTARLRSQ
ncbi:MAG TPA: EamA family transporter [Gemmatimonadales bacterium]|nr:EamA family transporter [Gemmatimonadales bacterium]